MIKLVGVRAFALVFICYGNVASTSLLPTREWNNYVNVLAKLADKQPQEGKVNTRNIGTDYFNVTFTSEPEKATVHSLRPHDIDIVGALGDSITAGTGIDARTLAGVAVQFRGLTWTAGGDQSLESSITIPNILRQYNPWVKGYSVGNGLGYQGRDDDWFNVAVPGGRAHDMFDQARDLIERAKNDSRTSFENDWKLISIFIGGNDLCALDRDPDGASPETYRDEIRKALDLFHAELPRALVQIIQIMEIYLLPEVSGGYDAPPLCGLVQRLACEHVVKSVSNETTLKELREINWEYQRLIDELVDSGRYDTRDDFTVIVQPFFKDTVLPVTQTGQVDATYFAPDCFHFSSKAHAMGALNLWNNMFERVGEKTTVWGLNDLKCPDESSPFIFTSENSHVTNPSTTSTANDQSAATCPELICNSLPDWAIGVMCAFAVLASVEILCLMVLLHANSKK